MCQYNVLSSHDVSCYTCYKTKQLLRHQLTQASWNVFICIMSDLDSYSIMLYKPQTATCTYYIIS